MKTKLLLIITLGISIAACSDESTNYESSTAPTYEEPNTETYSEGKKNYCADADDKNACSCQFDVMDPILTADIGSDWSTKSMEEKDFPTYVQAVEKAVEQCP